ncbi:hypothetical protein D8B26_002004 [Coccidioides posadasii str. Silveira]|uniref:Uncharacterized protein n=1 Tax=Coccidioides posadasii (strain RMSCC 757 / Silveira) TaxID=443226 RepID=E9CX65_COCPS|nr:conserved hypothetical protein [Coccidioides posadasii str. Silveira]QVM07303.1 hypothetical protein D8B26_002004 [Coccidioides posadasii str. Silveira]
MLDENLPTFYIKPSTERPKHQSTYYFCQGGEEPSPAYSVRHLDPDLPASKNRYAVALYDSFCPDILYGEVLLIPKWTQPSLSQEAIRQNNGVPPPPEPILPNEFIIQLYNPDQQVLVRYKPKSWNSPASWQFEMPQQTFRLPSGSSLDRTMSDPAASDITPKLRFNWQKDGKFSKDLTCYLSGKTVDFDDARKRSKEPDITVSIFKGLKEVTLYEPNLYRVEMEDHKGLEVVLLLGAVVIRDVYFGHIKTSFHITDPPNPTALAAPKITPPKVSVNGTTPQIKGQSGGPQPNQQGPHSNPPRQTTLPVREARPPPADPRTQWEIDAETSRLKQQAEAEARERRRKEKEAEKQTRKLLEAEERERRRREAQVKEETERLKKIYGKEDKKLRKQVSGPPSASRPPAPLPPGPPQFNNAHYRNHSSASTPAPSWFATPARPQTTQPTPQFLAPRPPASTAGGLRPPQPQLKERRSIFGFRLGDSRDSGNGLSKKRSSMF